MRISIFHFPAEKQAKGIPHESAGCSERRYAREVDAQHKLEMQEREWADERANIERGHQMTVGRGCLTGKPLLRVAKWRAPPTSAYSFRSVVPSKEVGDGY